MLQIQQIAIRKFRTFYSKTRGAEHTVKALTESIRTFGFLVPVLCDSRYRVISGRARIQAARRLRMKSVPAIVAPLTGVRALAFAIAHNRICAGRPLNPTVLKADLARCRRHNILPLGLGFDEAEITALMSDNRPLNWKSLDAKRKRTHGEEKAAVAVRIPRSLKHVVMERIRQYARRKGLSSARSPQVAGTVMLDALKVHK